MNVSASEKCFLDVRLMDAKISGIFETNKMFNKNIFILAAKSL